VVVVAVVVVVVVEVAVVIVIVMAMTTIRWDVCTEVCCKNQFRNGYLEVSEYGVSGVKPLRFCMLTAVNCTYYLFFIP